MKSNHADDDKISAEIESRNENKDQLWSLFKLILNDQKFSITKEKNKELIQHELILSNLDVNKDKLQICIDNNVKKNFSKRC